MSWLVTWANTTAATASPASGTAPSRPTTAVSTSRYSGSAASTGNAGPASRAISRSGTRPPVTGCGGGGTRSRTRAACCARPWRGESTSSKRDVQRAAEPVRRGQCHARAVGERGERPGRADHCGRPGEHPLLGRLVEQRPRQPAHHRVDVLDAALGEELAEFARVAVDDLEPGTGAAAGTRPCLRPARRRGGAHRAAAARRSRRSPRPCPGRARRRPVHPTVGTIEASTAESRVELGTTAPICRAAQERGEERPAVGGVGRQRSIGTPDVTVPGG